MEIRIKISDVKSVSHRTRRSLRQVTICGMNRLHADRSVFQLHAFQITAVLYDGQTLEGHLRIPASLFNDKEVTFCSVIALARLAGVSSVARLEKEARIGRIA